MKPIKSILTSEIFFFVTLSLLFLTIGFLPTILQAIHSGPDRVFPLMHNSPHDFNFYMALMNEGANGAWLVNDPFTTEPTPSSFVGSFFVLLGKIGHVVGLSHPVTYNLIRLISSILLLLSVYFLYSKIFDKKDRKIAFVFYLIAGSFLQTITAPDGTSSVHEYMEFWTGFSVTRRHVFLPHHVLANALVVTSFVFLLSALRQTNKQLTNKSIRTPFVAFILLTIAAFIHTPSALIFFIIFPSTISLLFIFRAQASTSKKLWRPSKLLKINHEAAKEFAIRNSQVIVFSLCWLLLIIPLLVIRQQSSLGFPWTQLTTWETATTYPVKEELFKGLGIVFITAVVGIFYVLKKKTIESTLVLSWLFVPLALIPFSTLLSINAIRLTQGALFVPMAAMAVYGVKVITGALLRLQLAHQLGEKKIELILVVLIIIISTPTIIHSYQSYKADLWNHASNIYLSHSDVRTFTALAQMAPPNSFVLCSFYTCNTVPGYAYVKTFIGSWTYTYNLAEKEAQTQKFLKGEMTEEEARQFLSTNKINFVITVNHDHWLYGWPGNRYPNLLEPLFQEETNGVYRVKKGI